MADSWRLGEMTAAGEICMKNEITITTPENVRITFELAGIGSRFVALLLDSILQGVLFAIILISALTGGITFGENIEGAFSWYLAALILITFLIFIGYFIFFEMIMKGRSPGKAIMKIRVMRRNGQPVTFVSTLLRNIFRIADFFPGLYGVGVLVMFISPESRRIGDYLGSTIVVKDRIGRIPATLQQLEAQDAAVRDGQTLNMYPISQEEYRLLKEFITRRDKLTKEKRQQLAQRIAERLWNKFNVPSEERKDAEKFLEMLLKANAQ